MSTETDVEALKRRAESFAKYHDEHAGYGGASQEFHARASTFIRDLAEYLASEREAREGDRTEWSEAVDGLRSALVQAERERDEARDQIEAWKDASGLLVGKDPDGATPAMLARDLRQQDAEMAATEAGRERAEADNATLHEALSSALDPHSSRDCGPGCRCGVILLLDAEHPGAALLEAHRREVEELKADNAALLKALRDVTFTDPDRDGAGHRVHMAADLLADEDHPGAALLKRLHVLEEVVSAFRRHEWLRTDWQGVCPYRRDKHLVCLGTDGRVAAVGPPTPEPHASDCPFAKLAALKGGNA